MRGKSRNVEYWHARIISIVFEYIDVHLHELGLSTLSLDSMGKHYYRNGTTLKFAIIFGLI